MQTQTEEAKMGTQTVIFVEGLPETKVKVDKENEAWPVTLKIGESYHGDLVLFFDKQENFKAFVGKLIEAVGK